jgi:hypothetical protein
MQRLPKLLILPLLGVFIACKPDCRESVRMGDFEFSQGNYIRAEKLYGDALRADPARCADAEGKRANALRFLNR